MSRIEIPQNRRSLDTREAIVEATWRLLESRGAPATTMAAVAAEAGVSRRAVYLHYASRSELFLGLRRAVDERLDLESSLRPIAEAPDAVAALDAWAAHVASYHSQIAPVMRAIEAVRHVDSDADALWNEARGRWHECCTSVTERLATEARLAPPWNVTTAADLLCAFMSVQFIDELCDERGWGIADLTHRLQVLARRALVSS